MLFLPQLRHPSQGCILSAYTVPDLSRNYSDSFQPSVITRPKPKQEVNLVPNTELATLFPFSTSASIISPVGYLPVSLAQLPNSQHLNFLYPHLQGNLNLTSTGTSTLYAPTYKYIVKNKKINLLKIFYLNYVFVHVGMHM